MTDWNDALAAVAVAVGGDRVRGRELLMGCWNDTVESDHSQRCVLAHYLADLQEDLDAEVMWDELALAAYQQTDALAFSPIGVASAEGFAPSLHLNLGDAYLRQGRVEDARSQLTAGLAGADALAGDGYAAMVRNGLAGLQQRVTAAG